MSDDYEGKYSSSQTTKSTSNSTSASAEVRMYSVPASAPRPLPRRFLDDPMIIVTETEGSEYTEDDLVQPEDLYAPEVRNVIESESAEASNVSEPDPPQLPRYRKSVKWQDDRPAQEQARNQRKDSTSKRDRKTHHPKARSGLRAFLDAFGLPLFCVAGLGMILAFGTPASTIESVRAKGLGSVLTQLLSMQFPQLGEKLGWPWWENARTQERRIRGGLKAQSDLADVHDLLAPQAELPRILAEARDGMYFLSSDADKMLPAVYDESRKVFRVIGNVLRLADEAKLRAYKITSIKTMVILNTMRANRHSSWSLTKYDYIMKEGPKINEKGSYSQTLNLVSFHLGKLLEQVEKQQVEFIELEEVVTQAQFQLSSIAFPGQSSKRGWKSITDSETFKDMAFVRFHPHVGQDLERMTGSFENNKRLGEAAVKIKDIKRKVDSLYTLLERKRVQGKSFNAADTLELWKDGVDHVLSRLEPVIEG